MLTDARGAELFVGDTIGTVTGGQNAMVIIGTVTALHEVKITIEVIMCEYTGDPISRWVRKLAEPGSKKQLNAYRVFRLGPCTHDQSIDVAELKWTDLYFETWRAGTIRVKMTHKPTGLTGEGEHPVSTLEAKAAALEELTRKVVGHERAKGH